jgi:adenylate cyclase
VITPNYADVLADSSTPLFYTGRSAEGIPLVERAMRLNPFHPSWYLWSLGRNLYGAGQHERAIQALSAVTDPVEPRLYLLASYVALGRGEEARAEVANIRRMAPDFSVEAWGETQPFRDPDDRRRLLAALRKAGLPTAGS